MANATHFGMRNSGLKRKIVTAGRPFLSEVNNSIDGGPLLLAPSTVDAKAQSPSARFVVDLLQTAGV